MKRLHLLLVCLTLSSAWAQASDQFSFAYVAHPFGDALTDESGLRLAMVETAKENLAFVVVGGIKSAAEPCSDELYLQRRELLSQSQHGLVVLAAESDWSDCYYRDGRSSAVERLRRLRELFFAGDLSFGASKIPLSRQSTNPKFRDYSENARWEIGDIMFATINLPSSNNRYLSAAGRNGEFEDRQIANHDWLQRIALHAKHKKNAGIVIFSDGNPLDIANESKVSRDGFREVRRQLNAISASFPGQILLVHNQLPHPSKPSPPVIRWRGKLGELAVSTDWVGISVTPTQEKLFKTSAPAPNQRTRE